MTIVPRLRAALAAFIGNSIPPGASMVNSSRGWWHLWSTGHGDTTTGSWQRDERMPPETALAFFAVYSCVTQIAADIAKLCLYVTQRDGEIWSEVENPATVRQFFVRPNHFQTMQQFVEVWMISKLTRGNTIALKVRDDRGVVMRQFVLEWDRVTPLVAPDSSVWYQLRTDDLSQIPFAQVTVPASEVIHDRMNCLFHPLIGISPLFASNLAAAQGLAMQRDSANFFKNMSRPGGVLTAPGHINDETAARLKSEFDKNYHGANGIGKTLVAGDGLKYEPMAVTPENAQIVEQLKLSALQVCSTFKMPPFMVGIGDMPGFENVQALTQWYYTACLQSLIEAFENCQDDGLALDRARYRTEFDLDDLLRMDSKTLAEVEGAKVQRGISSPNESRAKFNLPPADGGEGPYLQQQNFSLAALAKRDASADPFGKATPPPAPAPAPADQATTLAALIEVRQAIESIRASAPVSDAERVRAVDEAAQLRDELAATRFVLEVERLANAP